ncbi:hypothetical protein PRZ48_010638 [Zasmidium cellare]|uniref:Major facilitator superfamily (MFS) profile domain-containing protein n=1 Tax=Zasmidium cellare TaxID=395010 RepID=A0ABR0E994_ZASCE|nr:hypothetical protein PRZ48_010638 [Zasmidium cellare]
MSPSTPTEKNEATPYLEAKATPSSTSGTENEQEHLAAKEAGTVAAPVDDDGSLAPSTPDDGDDPNLPHGMKLFFIIVALVLSVFFFSLDQTIVATAIPKITDEFNSLDDISWYGSAFFLTIGGFQFMWGKMYKYFPLKISFLIAIFIFEVGSLICAVAHNSTTLIVGRAIPGVGAAGIGSGSYTIVTFAITVAALGISFVISLASRFQKINTESLTGGAA